MARITALSVELLECILLHISMQDLLILQRVCKTWRDVIQSCPQLQRNMFLGFVPDDLSTTKQLARFVHDNSKHSTIARKTQKSHDQSKKNLEKPANPEEELEKRFLACFNPVFPSDGEVIRTRTKQFREPLDSQRSWLNMYLTQPPCNYAEATVFYTPASSSSFHAFTRRSSDTAMAIVGVNRSKGVRARDVLQAVRDCHVSKVSKWQRIDIQVPGVMRA